MKDFRLSHWFLLICLFVIIGIFVYRYFILLPAYEKYGRYSIGIVLDAKIKMKGSIYDITFEYKKNGLLIKNSSASQIKINPQNIINKKFLVLYLSDKENQAEILIDYPVPDSATIPPNGWTEIPSWLKKQ